MKSSMDIKVHEVKAYPCGKVLSLHGWSKDQLEEALFKNVPTSSACWHCCHKFSWAPVRLPYQRDARFGRNVYYTTGVFCSFNCAKGYKLSTKTTKTSVMDIAVLANKMRQFHLAPADPAEASIAPKPVSATAKTSKTAKVTANAPVPMVVVKSGPQNAYFVKLPPPRNSLQMFGGTSTIDQWRDGFMKLDGSIIGTDPTNPMGMLKKRKRDVELPSFIDDSIAKMVRVSVAKTGILQNHRINENKRFYSSSASAVQTGPTTNPYQFGERAIQQKLEESRQRREVKSITANHRLDSIMKLSISKSK